MLLKGDQMPSVPLVAGDIVQVIAVPQAGQGSTIGGTHRLDAGALGHRVRRRTRTDQPDPVRGVGLPGGPRFRCRHRSPPMPRPTRSGSPWSARRAIRGASDRRRPRLGQGFARRHHRGHRPGRAAGPTGARSSWSRPIPSAATWPPATASTPTGGLASLFAAARRTLTPEDVWDHVDHLPGGLPVLFGLARRASGASPTRRPGRSSPRRSAPSTPTWSSTPAGCSPLRRRQSGGAGP